MPITNFDFPGVSFSQSFAVAGTGTQATLGVACVGQQFNLHKAGTDDAYKVPGTYSASSGLTATLLPSTGATLDGYAGAQHLVVQNGAFQYTEKNAASTNGYDIDERTVTFDVAIANGYGYTAASGFGTRGAKVGDPVLLTGTGGTSLTTILKLDYVSGVGIAKITVGSMGALTAVTKVGFCEQMNATYEYDEGAFTLDVSSNTNNLVIQGGLTAKLTDLSNFDGELIGGDLYFEYREFVQQYVHKLGTIGEASDIVDQLGVPCKDNPLALACLFAFNAGGGQTVFYTGVREDTADAYTEALDFLERYDGVYSIVPATEDKNIIQACAAACISVSSDTESSIRRALWYGVTNDVAPVVSPDGLTGTFTTTGSDPAVVTVATNKDLFTETAFQAGDKLQMVDSPYTVWDIASVSGIRELTLATGSVASGSDVRLKIIRTLPTSSDIVEDVVKRRCTTSERAVCVWADGLLYNGEELPNYPLAAAAAGMRSYEEPHRPLSNLGYSFFTLLDRNGLSKSQLKRIGAEGIWIIANNVDNTPVNMRQITTAVANNLNLDEESIIANVDTIAMNVSQVGRQYVGNSNISPMLLDVLEGDLRVQMDQYLTNATNAYVGPQLLDWNLLSLYQDQVNRDRVYADFECEPPKPFNKFFMHMRVI